MSNGFDSLSSIILITLLLSLLLVVVAIVVNHDNNRSPYRNPNCYRGRDHGLSRDGGHSHSEKLHSSVYVAC